MSNETIIITHELTASDEAFIDLLTGGKMSSGPHVGDLLLHGFSGYWLYGVEHDPKLGWLVVNQIEQPGIPRDQKDDILQAWRAGEELPEHFYVINRDVAIQVLTLGIKYYGTNFTDADVDYSQYDQFVQEVLLGESVYG